MFKYFLTVTDSFSHCRYVENFYEKQKVGRSVKGFVTFIENQIEKSVKHIRLDQKSEFGIHDLKF